MLAPFAKPFAALALLTGLLLAAPAAAQFQFDSGGFNFDDPAFGDDPAAAGDPVTISARFAPAADGQPAMVEVTAAVIPGYHISSITQAKGGPLPTSIEFDPASGVRLLGEWVPDAPPKTKIDQEIWVGLELQEYYGEVTWRAPVELPTGADPASVAVSGRLIGQACKDNCVPVELAFTAETVAPGTIPTPLPAEINRSVEVPIAKTVSTNPVPTIETGDLFAESLQVADTGGSLWFNLGGAFLGGLILNLMPCVLPVIGLKVLSFAEQAGHDRGRVLAMNLAYTAGLMTVFMLLACLAAFAGYGWGELNTHASYRIGMVVFVFAMALSFLGVWEIPLPGFAGGKGANELQQQEGFSGAFFKGAFTTILATPCSGPFLGPVFGWLITQPPAVTFLMFASIGLGMASPYLLIGLFPSLVRFLPKPGAWMETFKQLMGFVLMGTAVYFLFWVVSPANQKAVAVTLVAVSLACWWIGRTPITATGTHKSTAWIGGWGTAALVGWLAFSLFSNGAAAVGTPDGAQLAAAPVAHGTGEHELPWQAFSKNALADARSSGKTVLIDFTANWCPTCQTNSVLAINTERVKTVVESNDVVTLLADWSDPDPEIKQALEWLGSRSIPFLAIFPADRPNEPIRLPDVITESQLLSALAKAGAVAGNDSSLDMPKIEIGDAAAPGTFR